MEVEYLFIKKEDDFCNDIEGFKNLLLTNNRITIDDKILHIGKCDFNYFLRKQNIEKVKEISFYLCIKSIEGMPEDKQISSLERANTVIRRIVEKYKDFYINTIWDDVSIYYGEKLYPHIVNIENLLRKIIYRFMIKILGSQWVEQALPKEVKESIQKTLEKNKESQENVHNILEDCLYSADFIQLGLFFFNKYSNKNDFQRLIRDLKSKEKLTKSEIEKLVQPYESMSNWDRYFSDKLNIENLWENWKQLYGYRNKIAHSKIIDKKDYDVAMSIIKKLKVAFNKCLDCIDEVEVTPDECEMIKTVANQTIENNLISNVIKTIEASPYSNKSNATIVAPEAMKRGVYASSLSMLSPFESDKYTASIAAPEVVKQSIYASSLSMLSSFESGKGTVSITAPEVVKQNVYASSLSILSPFERDKGTVSITAPEMMKNNIYPNALSTQTMTALSTSISKKEEVLSTKEILDKKSIVIKTLD